LKDILKNNPNSFEDECGVLLENNIILQDEINNLQEKINELNLSLEEQKISIQDLKILNESLKNNLKIKDNQIEEYKKIIQDKNSEIDNLIKFKEDVLNSNSWKMTKVFRKIKK
jgi:SMC interacting uncharacterized protein involved in chromosome segregation